jgi:hypothetical protein
MLMTMRTDLLQAIWPIVTPFQRTLLRTILTEFFPSLLPRILIFSSGESLRQTLLTIMVSRRSLFVT